MNSSSSQPVSYLLAGLRCLPVIGEFVSVYQLWATDIPQPQENEQALVDQTLQWGQKWRIYAHSDVIRSVLTIATVVSLIAFGIIGIRAGAVCAIAFMGAASASGYHLYELNKNYKLLSRARLTPRAG